MKNILVTGGAGYIGSHTVVELLENDYTVTVVDNLGRGFKESFDGIKAITGKSVEFYEADIRDTQKLLDICKRHPFDAVIHFAGFKAVGESMADPLLYYDNNVSGTVALCQVVQQAGIPKIVFSSSSTVYGDNPIPYKEDMERRPVNPYGRTKYIDELILEDLTVANKELIVASLRYFNPVGAHPSGKIGEVARKVPDNLMPFITQVAVGNQEKLRVFGNDYDTPDGTAIRDYIHIMDLAEGHLAALEKVTKPGFHAYSLSDGKGSSVLDVVNAFERATGIKIPLEFVNRRPGDFPAYYADVSKAKKELGWSTKRTIEDSCRDAWNWQSSHPNGYSK